VFFRSMRARERERPLVAQSLRSLRARLPARAADFALSTPTG
jgi:hypothetical protein